MKTVTLAAKLLASAAMAVRWYRLAAKLGNASAQDEGGHTPLHEAARNGRTEAVTTLLNAGADPNAQDGRGRRAGASRPLREPVVRYRTRRRPGARRARAVPGSAWRDPNPPPPWTAADRVWLHEDQRRRGIDEPDGWVVRELPDGADVCAGPRARDALRLARDLRGHSPLSQRDDAKLFAWPVTAAELDALAKHLPPSALGIVEGAVPWWREADR